LEGSLAVEGSPVGLRQIPDPLEDVWVTIALGNEQEGLGPAAEAARPKAESGILPSYSQYLSEKVLSSKWSQNVTTSKSNANRIT